MAIERVPGVVVLPHPAFHALCCGAPLAHVPDEPPTLVARKHALEDDVTIPPVAIP